MSVRKPIWSFFIPTTAAAKVRTASYATPAILFAITCSAVQAKQMYYRNDLHSEAEATHDRIERRGYVALPDGRMALVHPQVDARITVANLGYSLWDAINPIP